MKRFLLTVVFLLSATMLSALEVNVILGDFSVIEGRLLGSTSDTVYLMGVSNQAVVLKLSDIKVIFDASNGQAVHLNEDTAAQQVVTNYITNVNDAGAIIIEEEPVTEIYLYGDDFPDYAFFWFDGRTHYHFRHFHDYQHAVAGGLRPIYNHTSKQTVVETAKQNTVAGSKRTLNPVSSQNSGKARQTMNAQPKKSAGAVSKQTMSAFFNRNSSGTARQGNGGIFEQKVGDSGRQSASIERRTSEAVSRQDTGSGRQH